MGRYTGAKARINRRLGMMVFETAGAMRAADRKPNAPGMAERRRKQSTYGLALAEKQKIKYYYGLREKQLRKYFARAQRMKGNTGENLLILCERRLDNVIRRAGLAITRPQARQGVAHSHFQINGKTVRTPSIVTRVGHVISVRNRPNLRTMYTSVIESGSIPACDWVAFEPTTLTATVTALPSFDDVSLPVDVGQVVAFLSR